MIVLGVSSINKVTGIAWINASRCHCYSKLPLGRVPSDPRGRLTIAAMCGGVYTLSFEMGMVDFVSTFKRI